MAKGWTPPGKSGKTKMSAGPIKKAGVGPKMPGGMITGTMPSPTGKAPKKPFTKK